MAKLREYQQRAIDMLYDWMRECDGNPCLVLPTGAGKSHVVAALCKDAVTNWPETRILMLTHVKELIEQNAEKMRQHWPNAPMGIYSASLGQKILGEPITFAGIQSIIRRLYEVGHVDLIIIDECHLVSHKDEGSYRTLINTLREINPRLRVIGLTATPYRLGHGLITEGPTAIFDGLIEPVTIEELIALGHLAPLRSKHTDTALSTEGVHTRGGEYIESELQAAVNTADNNTAIVRETFRRADNRGHWLFFCAGVEHAEAMAQCLRDHGVTAECVHGGTAKTRREEILNAFKAGEILALTNANVLTTGFDYPDIDLIVFARPTKSKGLYVQMAGRGLRPKSHTDHCLVLDFAGLVAMHGPITDTTPSDTPSQSSGEGEAPVKVCEVCSEVCHLSAKICPACGEPFPAADPKDEGKEAKLYNHDIMQREGPPLVEMKVARWHWEAYTSRTSGKSMLRVTYYGEAISDERVAEYYCVMHDGFAGAKAQQKLSRAADYAGVVNVFSEPTLDDAAFAMNCGKPPSIIKYVKNGKFHEVKATEWSNTDATSEA